VTRETSDSRAVRGSTRNSPSLGLAKPSVVPRATLGGPAARNIERVAKLVQTSLQLRQRMRLAELDAIVAQRRRMATHRNRASGKQRSEDDFPTRRRGFAIGGAGKVVSDPT
jgi:hypothetical protein